MSDLSVKLITQTNSGTRIRVPVTMRYTSGRIEFIKSPFSLKDTIKAMKGSRWHGFQDPPRKIWSVTDCERNRFQLDYMQGKNPYKWWDKSLETREYTRPLREHQKLMADFILTYHYGILAAEMGVGKTLSIIEVMERSGIEEWWWIGPKSAIKAVEREFYKWKLSQKIGLTIMTYESLRNLMKKWTSGDIPPQGVIFDESARLKTFSAQRTVAAQALADGVREHYGKDGYVVLMSGSPAPKSPKDWFAQAEIAWPGFIKEGSEAAFEHRLGLFVLKETSQGKHLQRVTWLDDENKCKFCGQYVEDHEDDHPFAASFNEVAYLYKRLDGLVLVLRKKDVLDLPEKIYRTVICKPTATMERVSRALANAAPNAITGLTWLRELSDGFQYKEVADGIDPCPVCQNGITEIWQDPDDPVKTFEMVDLLDPLYVETLQKVSVKCPTCNGTSEVPHMTRITKVVPCPKDAALKDLLEENEEQGRLVVFAGFTGSIDRIVSLCQTRGWAVVRVDGRGWKVWDIDGAPLYEVKPLDFWADVARHPRVVFIAHPRSGGLGLTLTESRMAVFYSNDFNPDSRTQAEARIHRIGMDDNRGATIVDLIHLPTDEKVRAVLRDNQKLELLTLGEIQEVLGEE